MPIQLKRILKRLTHLQKALDLVWQSSKTYTIANIVILVLQGILPLVSLYLTKKIIDSVSIGIQNTQAENILPETLWLVVLAAIAALIYNAASVCGNLVNEAQSQLVTDYVQNILHQKSIEVDLEYYENHKYYDTLHQAQSEAPYRPTLILNTLVQFFQSVISLAGISLLLLSLHWGILLLLLFASLPSLIIKLKFADALYRQWQQWTPTERLAQYLHNLLTQSFHAKEIRLFQLGNRFQQNYNELRTSIRNSRLNLIKKRTLTELITQWSATVSIFIATGFIAYSSLQGKITIGSLVMYYQAFQQGLGWLRESLASLASLYENSLFLSNLSNFLDLKPKIIESINPSKFPKSIQIGIEFKQVKFKYPHSNRPVLENINFKINAGETVAIVGENGAGKTSLIKLLCRLYEPTEGMINIDKINIQDFAILELRKNISVVFQDYARYNLSVRENIGFGELNLLFEDEKIELAAYNSGADKAIAKLPFGYNTILGNEFEKGEELSIGEWQKIAIARAFLRKSQIIILDEPTSALDPEAEADILEKFYQLTNNKTAIIISHRLSSLRLVDRILVLEKGKIVEAGNHQELMDLNGSYAHLFNIQAQHYN